MKGLIPIKLIIAEKPSVGQTISNVLGVANRKDGYFFNDEYYVSWCIGHLVSSVYPNSYDEKYKKWCIEDLPIFPEPFEYEVSKDKLRQFKILEKLMNSNNVNKIICATDSGREGELIFRLVYNMAGCTKPVKRLWTSSLEDKAIVEGMNNLRDSKDFENLYYSADCREKADWLVGMNLTRLLSVLYGTKLAVGRVKTPTLAMIANRDKEIKELKRKQIMPSDLILTAFLCPVINLIQGIKPNNCLILATPNKLL